MKKRAIALTLAGILVLFIAAYLWGPSAAPPGQEPLVVLSSANFDRFQKAFDSDSDVPRLVLLVSPT